MPDCPIADYCGCDENNGSLDVRLTPAELEQLYDSKVTMPGEGNRYPSEHMKRVG